MRTHITPLILNEFEFIPAESLTISPENMHFLLPPNFLLSEVVIPAPAIKGLPNE
jgi:hypothetical protein